MMFNEGKSKDFQIEMNSLMYQCRLGTQQQKRSFAEKVLRILVDSKSTCASNVYPQGKQGQQFSALL